MEVNNEDGNIAQNIPGHFNINTGLWEYKSLSKHTPKDLHWEPMAHLCSVIVDLNIPMHQVMQLKVFLHIIHLHWSCTYEVLQYAL